MSLNSLQDDMSRRAASMAAMAKRANNPQDIQAIQKSLVTGVQNGSIQPYVGIPLIQELTKKLTEAKAQMAQSMAGAGMQQAPQGQQAPQPPIAQQVMQQAAQESQGLEALPSNLPESYAGGGIIAFEEGGQVERYQNQGLVGSSPAGRFFSGLGQSFSEQQEAAKLRNKLQMQYGPKSALPGLFMNQSDAERQMAKDISGRLPTMTLSEMQALYNQGPSALPAITPPVTPTSMPVAAPAVVTPTPLASAPAPAAPAAPAIPGAGKFVPPTLDTFKPTILTLPERKMEPLTDLGAITKNLPKDQKTVVDTAVTTEQAKLEAMDKPGNEAREAKFGKREAEQEKNSAMGRALNLISLGLGVAGSKERSLAGALGKEGREGIQGLIQGEAASRAAKERLDDARDNFEQQKIQAKKGNYQAAQTAGREAGRDLLAATQFAYTSAAAGNAQGISMFNALSQSDINKLTASNQGEQLRAAAVASANQNKLGVAGLGLQAQQLAQQGDIARAQLAAREKQFAAMSDANKARIMTARSKGINDFMMGEGGQLRAQLAKDYGPNFLTATDARSIEAARIFNQRKQAYLADITGQAIDALGARQADALLLDQ
jgi:hypothetical protein